MTTEYKLLWSHKNDLFFPSPYLNVKFITYKNILCEFGLFRTQNDNILKIQEDYSKVKEIEINKCQLFLCKNVIKKTDTQYIPKNHKIVIQHQERYTFPKNESIVLCKDTFVDVSKQEHSSDGLVKVEFSMIVQDDSLETPETMRYIQLFLNMFQRKCNK